MGRILSTAAMVVLLAGGVSGEGPRRVAVTPSRANVEPGGSIAFSVRSPEGVSDAGTLFEWRVIPAWLGSIDGGGLFIAGDRPGRGIVRVTITGGETPYVGHAFIRVGSGNGSLPRLRIVPGRVTTATGETVTLRALVENGDESAQVKWTVRPAWLGTITPGGLFRAGQRPGNGTILAVLDDRNGSDAGHARLTVVASHAGLEPAVRPRTVEIPAGERVRFTVEGIPADTPVEWSAQPATIGTITPDGLFTANEVIADVASGEPLVREGRVIASAKSPSGRWSGAARVIVGGRERSTRLVIEPPALLVTRSVDGLGANAAFGALHARTVGPNGIDAPIVHWRIEGSPLLRVFPKTGASTRVLLDLPGKSAADVKLEAVVVAEIILENGARIGAKAPVRIVVTGLGIVLDVFPRKLDLRVGETAPLDLRATTLDGRRIGDDLLHVESGFDGKALGVLDPASGEFHATRAGRNTLRIRAALKGAPSVHAETSVDIVVRPGNTDIGNEQQ